MIGAIPAEGTIRWGPGTKIGYVPQKLDLERDLPLAGLDFLRQGEGFACSFNRNRARAPRLLLERGPLTIAIAAMLFFVSLRKRRGD